MSDFTSGFWNVFVVGITAVSIIGCGVLLWMQSRVRVKPGGKGADTTGHVWDGDLEEYNNPLPKWWMNLFWITLVFSAVYLVLYPGMGTFPGVLGWSQVGQYERERAQAEARVKPLYDKYAAMDLRAVAADPQARLMGERLFLNNCAQCHGSDAGGARGFPNLRDGDWLYGGEPAQIVESITNGRMGVMPPQGAALGDEGVRNVVAYVRSLSGLTADPLKAQLGKEKYLQVCAACHGPDGKGNQALGAPNLTDKVWLYGSSEAAITETVVKGRNMNVSEGTLAMPAFKDLLGPARVHLVAAYVLGLSGPPAK
ncbi:MAG: cytochrome-c oxidase, cbb3-type subunit III [Burkholderiales bacterium]|nr:cytochrome-c oxidase, cbb3-type subunit III [Burkholderiales bacterium]GIK84755.1 MAG: Cbb3-type cytochrome c oxidase subunit [Betaproteobacteria bacterium]